MKTIMERWRYECENSGTDPFRSLLTSTGCEPVMGNKQSRVMGYTFQYGWFGLFGKGIMVRRGDVGRRPESPRRTIG
jgi:hypothetical protein